MPSGQPTSIPLVLKSPTAAMTKNEAGQKVLASITLGIEQDGAEWLYYVLICSAFTALSTVRRWTTKSNLNLDDRFLWSHLIQFLTS